MSAAGRTAGEDGAQERGGGGRRGREDVASGATNEDDPVIVTTQHLSIPAQPPWGVRGGTSGSRASQYLDLLGLGTDVHVGLYMDHDKFSRCLNIRKDPLGH